MLRIKYNCGCGYTTSDMDEAISHSDHFGHTIPVLGYVVPSTNSKDKEKVVLTVEEGSYEKD